MSDTQGIAVIGGGSWATAIMKMLLNNLDNVYWWMRNENAIEHILQHGHNPNYISSVEFPVEKLTVSSNLNDILSQTDVLIFAVPSAFLKETLSGIDSKEMENKIIFSAIKGIVPENNVVVGDFFHHTFSIPYDNIGVISGPCHAEEVAMEKLSYLTVSCQVKEKAEMMADALRCRYVKCSVSNDIYGTEYSAVLKNVFAIASGICHGLGYGDNFQAVLISNAIREIKRFVDTVHPISRDIKDSAYLGDLLVTAYSQFSRNRTFGNMIGKGYSVKSVMMEMDMIAEGYYAVKCIKEINKQHNVDMPITDAVYNIVYDKISPLIEMKILEDKLS